MANGHLMNDFQTVVVHLFCFKFNSVANKIWNKMQIIIRKNKHLTELNVYSAKCVFANECSEKIITYI